MVVEIENGKVLNDSRIIAGQSQKLRLRTGFNKAWTGWEDIDWMLWAAQNYLDRPKGDVKGEFIAVVEGKVIGKYELLSEAQAQFKKYSKDAKTPIRIIFEVKNGVISDDPRTIAGRNQLPGNLAGFNSYWETWTQVDTNLWAAEDWMNTPKGNVDGDFLVVAETR